MGRSHDVKSNWRQGVEATASMPIGLLRFAWIIAWLSGGDIGLAVASNRFFDLIQYEILGFLRSAFQIFLSNFHARSELSNQKT